MQGILIIFAHPLLEKSRVHTELARQAGKVHGVTVHDLYQQYPDFDIDIQREQSLLQSHDIIIWQHPVYWYSAPALLKQWQDMVLEHGWAYGHEGHQLDGKKIFNTLSTGGGAQVYQHEGLNRYTIHEFLRPFERTAGLCRMTYWPPFWIPGVHRMDLLQIAAYGRQYAELLTALATGAIPAEQISNAAIMNDVLHLTTTTVTNGK